MQRSLFKDVPDHVLQGIINRLSVHDAASLSAVSRSAKKLVGENSVHNENIRNIKKMKARDRVDDLIRTDRYREIFMGLYMINVDELINELKNNFERTHFLEFLVRRFLDSFKDIEKKLLEKLFSVLLTKGADASGVVDILVYNLMHKRFSRWYREDLDKDGKPQATIKSAWLIDFFTKPDIPEQTAFKDVLQKATNWNLINEKDKVNVDNEEEDDLTEEEFMKAVFTLIKRDSKYLKDTFPFSKPTRSTTTHSSSTGGAQKHTYNNRKYKIRVGSRGGKYILVQGKKVYI